MNILRVFLYCLVVVEGVLVYEGTSSRRYMEIYGNRSDCAQLRGAPSLSIPDSERAVIDECAFYVPKVHGVPRIDEATQTFVSRQLRDFLHRQSTPKTTKILSRLLEQARRNGAAILVEGTRIDRFYGGGIARMVEEQLREAGVSKIRRCGMASAAIRLGPTDRNVLCDVGTMKSDHGLESWSEFDEDDEVWVWIEMGYSFTSPPQCGIILIQCEQAWEGHFRGGYLFYHNTILDESCPRAIMDFAQYNIDALDESARKAGADTPAAVVALSTMQFPQVSERLVEPLRWMERDIDVLFLGHLSPRRYQLLHAISIDSGYKIAVVSQIFGTDAIQMARRAKILLNIRKIGPPLRPPSPQDAAPPHFADQLPPTMELHRLSEFGPHVGFILSEEGDPETSKFLQSINAVQILPADQMGAAIRQILSTTTNQTPLQGPNAWRALLEASRSSWKWIEQGTTLEKEKN